ncbi:MAG: hypothetical protein WBM46_07230 [Polyangiales bacterium]
MSRTHALMLTLALAACGEDPSMRLARSFEALCEFSEECSPGALPFDECVDRLWTAAAPFHHVYGDTCLDALASQVECRLRYQCYFDEGDGELVCVQDAPSHETCELVLFCEPEAAGARSVCGGRAFDRSLGVMSEEGSGGVGGGGSGGDGGFHSAVSGRARLLESSSVG